METIGLMRSTKEGIRVENQNIYYSQCSITGKKEDIEGRGLK